MSFASKALRDQAVRVRALSKFTSDSRALKAIEEHSAELVARADEMDRLKAEDEERGVIPVPVNEPHVGSNLNLFG